MYDPRFDEDDDYITSFDASDAVIERGTLPRCFLDGKPAEAEESAQAEFQHWLLTECNESHLAPLIGALMDDYSRLPDATRAQLSRVLAIFGNAYEHHHNEDVLAINERDAYAHAYEQE